MLYARPPRSIAACHAAAREQLACARPWRELAALLRESGVRYGVPAAALTRLEELERGRAVMVVTGQQVGYFGGPFYTLLKAYHAVRLAAELSRELVLPVIPLFWLEGEDHDLDEVRTAHYLDRTDELHGLRFEPERIIPGYEVGYYEVDAGSHIDELAAALELPDHEGVELLRECYSRATLSDALGRLLARLLGPRGLIIVEGGQPALKALAMPLWERVLAARNCVGEMLTLRSTELHGAGWSTPLSPTPDAYLFYLSGPDRVRVAVSHDGVLHYPGGATEQLPPEAVERLVLTQQLYVSPKAALRPLYQDFLLPTVAYVAGPGELDYHAQVAPFYSQLEVVPPSLFPRLSVSLLDARAQKFVEKLGLPLDRLLGAEHDALVRELVRDEDDGRTAAVFAAAREQIEAIFEHVGRAAAELDSTLAGAAHGAAGKTLHVLSELQQKSERALKGRHAVALGRLEKALARLRPHGKLAERVLSTGYYLAKLGPERLLAALDALPIDAREHQVVELD